MSELERTWSGKPRLRSKSHPKECIVVVDVQPDFVFLSFGDDRPEHDWSGFGIDVDRDQLLTTLGVDPEREMRRDAVIAAARALLDEADPEVRDGYWMIDDGAHWALHRALLALDAAPASQATPPVVMITLTDDEHLVMLDALASHLDWLAETKRDYASAMRLYQRLGAEPVDRASAAPAAGDS